MARRDFMLHVPYQDFNIFIRLLQEASIDPRVTEISLTVYRVVKKFKSDQCPDQCSPKW